jgi:hypothetical protein
MSLDVVECPVCLRDIELETSAQEGDVFECPFCSIELRLVKTDGGLVAERV